MAMAMEPMEQRVAARYIDAHFLVEAMSNLRSKSTGVDGAVIWISAGEFEGKSLRHGPRIKVVEGDKITAETLKDAVSVTIDSDPRVIGKLSSKVQTQVIRFVQLNLEALKGHWDGDLDAVEVLSKIKKV